jgi:hypothetical protein
VVLGLICAGELGSYRGEDGKKKNVVVIHFEDERTKD